MRRTWLELAGAASALMLSGCLTFQEVEYRVRRGPQDGIWEVTTTWRNLQSDEAAAEKQREDFDSLLQAWKDDSYLMDGVRDGSYVKGRRLRVEGGVLVGTELRLVNRDSRLESFEFGPGDTVRWKDRSLDIVSTNGRVEGVADTGGVSWGPGLRELELRARNRDFEPRSDFVKLFKASSRGR